MKNRTDLILGEAFCIFIFFYFLDCGLSLLNGLQFYFRLRDSENREFLVMAVSSTFLNGLCHEETAALGQFCAEFTKSLYGAFSHQKMLR